MFPLGGWKKGVGTQASEKQDIKVIQLQGVFFHVFFPTGEYLPSAESMRSPRFLQMAGWTDGVGPRIETAITNL